MVTVNTQYVDHQCFLVQKLISALCLQYIIFASHGYDLLYSTSPLASLDRFSRSHGDGLYVMQLVVAATNQNVLYKKPMFCRKNVNKIKMRVHIK